MSTGLLEIAWKGTAILLIAAAIVWALRRASAAARHFVWAIAMALALAVPLAIPFGPQWHVEVLPAGWDAVPPARVVAPIAPTASPAAALVTPAVGEREDTGRDWIAIAVRVWLAGVAVGLLRLIIGFGWAAWIARRAMRVPASKLLAFIAEEWNALAAGRPLHVVLTPHMRVPVACGILRPRLLLPLEAARWERALCRSVLLHELAHVKRRDCLVQAVARAACAVHWFNPLMFVAAWRLRVEQERACDDLVLEAGMAGPDYAEHLCEIAGHARGSRVPEWGTLAMAGRSNLETRIRAILEGTRRPRPNPRRQMACAAAAVLLMLPFGGLHLAAIAALPLPGGTARLFTSLMPAALEPRPATDLETPAPAAPPVAPANTDAPLPPTSAPSADFSGTWVPVDPATASSATAPRSVVIRHVDDGVTILYRGDEAIERLDLRLDGVESRYVDERKPVGGGVTISGRDVKAAIDGSKLVAHVRPFSAWQAGENADESSVPGGSTIELLTVHTLSPDGTRMTIERIRRADWGWDFDGREPSAAYARTRETYTRAEP